MTSGPSTTHRVLTDLAAALAALSAALATGRADDVLAVEPRLAAAVDQARTRMTSAPAGAHPSDLALVAQVRDLLAQCRRCGATVPTMLSVMFPGQVAYGRAGAHVHAAPVRPGLARVI